MKTGLTRWGLAMVLATLGWVTITDQARAAEPVSAKAAFEQLKSLAGQWQGTVQEKEKGPAVTVTYRVTAAGSAVFETLFPGTDHEMVTVYHLDGDALMLTHYCAMGNQPRMRLSAKSTAKEFVFEFDGGTNLKPDRDMHMHSGRIRIDGKDTLVSEWDVYQDGKASGANKFFLTRKN